MRKSRMKAGPAMVSEDDFDDFDTSLQQDLGSRASVMRSRKPAFLVEFLSKRRKSVKERDYEQADLLPDWCRRYTLRQHVQMMMKTYPDRMQKFLELKKELSVEIEMRKMGMTVRDLRLESLKKPPKTIELSRMPVLYSETYDRYIAGYYKEVKHDYIRSIRKVWVLWYRVYRRIDVRGSRKPSKDSDRGGEGRTSIVSVGGGGDRRSICSPTFDTEQHNRTVIKSLQKQLDEFV
jgi:hypothetical protein